MYQKTDHGAITIHNQVCTFRGIAPTIFPNATTLAEETVVKLTNHEQVTLTVATADLPSPGQKRLPEQQLFLIRVMAPKKRNGGKKAKTPVYYHIMVSVIPPDQEANKELRTFLNEHQKSLFTITENGRCRTEQTVDFAELQETLESILEVLMEYFRREIAYRAA